LHACQKQKGKTEIFEINTALGRAKELNIKCKGVSDMPFEKVDPIAEAIELQEEFKLCADAMLVSALACQVSANSKSI